MAGPYFNGMCAEELAAMYPERYAAALLGAVSPGGVPGGQSVTEVSPAPANFTDFSMFPGGVAPTTGAYVAFTATREWVYVAGDTQWRYTDRVSS